MFLRKSFFLFGFLLLCSYHFGYSAYVDDYPTLAIGASAPDFSLPGIDEKHTVFLLLKMQKFW